MDPLLLPMDTAVAKFNEINLPDQMLYYVMQGQAIQAAGLKPDELVRITIGDERRFVGMGTMNDDGLLAPKRLIVIHDNESVE